MKKVLFTLPAAALMATAAPAATLTPTDMMLGDVTWAATNVDAYQTFAARPDMYTKLYQWNKETAWDEGSSNVSGWSATPNSAKAWIINPCPAGWRLPTKEEWQALDMASGGDGYYNSTGGTGTWASAGAKGNAVNGRFFGLNHATCSLTDGGSMVGCIFLPAGGYRHSSEGALYNQRSTGYYWSSTQYNGASGYSLRFTSRRSDPIINTAKGFGISLRCVR